MVKVTAVTLQLCYHFEKNFCSMFIVDWYKAAAMHQILQLEEFRGLLSNLLCDDGNGS